MMLQLVRRGCYDYGGASCDGHGLGEGLVRVHGRFPGTRNVQRTGGECFSMIVESFTGIDARIFGEKFGNLETVFVVKVMVLKIFARFDFLTIMDPNHIKMTGTDYFARQFKFSTVFGLG